jgi:hypothetical protein
MLHPQQSQSELVIHSATANYIALFKSVGSLVTVAFSCLGIFEH